MSRRSNDHVDAPERQCHGKAAYGSKTRAKLAIRRIPSSGLRLGLRSAITAYRCPHCGHFHIGHSPP